MLIDLHCHTATLSPCSDLAPGDLVDLAKQRGLDGICLTEHDKWWPPEELATLRQRTGFLVLSAVELTTDIGHVLGFGLTPTFRGIATGELAHTHARASGGLLFLAHPARDGLLRITADTIRIFESVEAVNGSDSRLQNMAATGLAKGFRLPGIAGSDAHTQAEIGRAATEFDAEIHDEESLVAALRSGRYRAKSLE